MVTKKRVVKKKLVKKITKRKVSKKIVRKNKKSPQRVVRASKKISLPVKPLCKPLGKVTHFFDKISVAVVALNSALKVGDKIKIGKIEPLLVQTVVSMQLDHKPLKMAKKGQEIGLKVKGDVRKGDIVFKA